MGTLYGIVFFSHQLGGFLGVWLGGMMYDLYASYTLVWWIGVGFGALSALIHLPIKGDSDYIYFCLTTADRNKIMKILRNGFTVWLDPQESDGKTFGIQYPIKKEMDTENNEMMQGKRRLNNRERDNDRSNKNESMGRNRENISKMMIERFKSNQNEILIVNEDNYPLNAFKLQTEHGLEANINFERDQLVYELRMPIANKNQNNFFTDVLPNEKLEVRFESGEMKKLEFGEVPGEGRREGGMKPPEDGNEGGVMSHENRQGGGRGGRLNGRNMSDLMEPIDFSIMVKLAAR